MSHLLYLLENEVQLFALAFLGIVYTLRLVWLFRFQSRKERTYPAGNAGKGVALSLLNVAMPWAMESTRKRPGFYLQFAIFHLGVVFAIGATFIIPYWPGLFEHRVVVILFQTIIGAAFLVGVYRLYRRLRSPHLRLISTWDDYFSLLLMIFYFALGFVAVPNNYRTNELPLILFFALTAFFLIYVPFSKICHYLYYPFTRYFLGRTMGHRGVVAKDAGRLERGKVRHE
jgi:nitrate reductase gamma subunit